MTDTPDPVVSASAETEKADPVVFATAKTEKAKRIILEMGTGNDLYGEDYTKAAKRAVQDALHHSSLTLFKHLDIDPATMQIELRIGAQKPDAVDLEEVAAELPYGKITPVAMKGGLNIHDPVTNLTSVIVNAHIVVRLVV